MKKFTGLCVLFLVVATAAFFGNYLANQHRHGDAPIAVREEPKAASQATGLTTDGSEIVYLRINQTPVGLEGRKFFLMVIPQEENGKILSVIYDQYKLTPKVEDNGAKVVFRDNDGKGEFSLYRTRDAATKKMSWVLLRYKPQLEMVSTDANPELVQTEVDKLASK